MSKKVREYEVLPERALLFALYLVTTYVFGGLVAGQWVPSSGGDGLWFLSVVGLLAFRLLSAPFFAKPADALVAAITSALILWSIDLTPVQDESLRAILDAFRWTAVGLFMLVAVTALAATALRSVDPVAHPGRGLFRTLCYRFSTVFGGAEILFTPVALVGTFGFFPTRGPQALALAAYWIAMVSLRPYEGVLAFVREVRRDLGQRGQLSHVGRIQRIDSPGIVRVWLDAPKAWAVDRTLLCRLSDGGSAWVLPLFRQTQSAAQVGTGLMVRCNAEPPAGMLLGATIEWDGVPARPEVVKQLTKLDEPSELIGFVVEDSKVGVIRFEVASNHRLEEGLVVFVRQGGNSVYYQIMGGDTWEESFDQNPRGTHRVTASQLGIPGESGFVRHTWVPAMNAPVFMHVRPEEEPPVPAGFHIGRVPGTGFHVMGDFSGMAELHTAVLGITGMGKTEFALDVIRQGLDEGAKVFCVDFTGEYQPRLADRNPIEIALSEAETEKLVQLVDAVETGQFSAADEKKALWTFLAEIKPGIEGQISEFLEADGPGLALFQLNDIANTRSTLRMTELFVSEIFRWAREHRQARRILLVLEEAHTIVPEFNLFGHDRSDTMAVVGRISQIALQGRKYGVGLLLVSQRTALVSKTVLSQCNTVVAFSLVDRTSLEYLRNVFGEEHLQVIPNLSKRRALVFGSGIRSEKPVVVEIPFDQSKLDASEALNVTLDGETAEST